MTLRPLTERDMETLWALEGANRNLTEVGFRNGWARPMDCGGRDGSHHSATLQKLAKRRLVEVMGAKKLKFWQSALGGGAAYKITDAGRAELATWLEARKAKRS